jgi:ribosomal protein L37AE/L43A
MSQNIPSRFIKRLLVSTLSGFMLNCQWGHAAEPPVTHAIPASLEMMQLLRDEHGLIAEMVRAQLATERNGFRKATAVSGADPTEHRRPSGRARRSLLAYDARSRRSGGNSMLAIRELMQEVANQAVLQPTCPSCGRTLRLSRTTPRTSGLSDLRTYSCRECGVWITEAAEDRVGWRASSSF